MRVGRGLNPTAASCHQGGPVAPGPDAEGRAGPPRREDSPFSLHAGPADTGLLQPSQPPSEKGTGTGATPIAQTGLAREGLGRHLGVLKALVNCAPKHPFWFEGVKRQILKQLRPLIIHQQV